MVLKEEIMNYCNFCNLPFTKSSKDKVEHEGKLYHSICRDWLLKPRPALHLVVHRNCAGCGV